MRAYLSLLFCLLVLPTFAQLSVDNPAVQLSQHGFYFEKVNWDKGENTSAMLNEESLMLIHLNTQPNGKAFTPFFCAIEDRIAKSSKVNLRFRLGSVDYVNALEGKSYFQAVSNSKATNLMMRYH